MTGGTTFENEIHDCQRLVHPGADGYAFGALVGIFPLDSAMGSPPAWFALGRIAASIYSWGTQDDPGQRYDPLQIGPGWQCLWLRHDRGAWSAAVTPVEGAPCESAGPHPPRDYSLLDVRQLDHEDPEAMDPTTGYYPPTARWRWDATNGKHYIGIKCGTAWCVIGDAAGFAPREPNPLTGIKERSIPGWYDEQHLAIYDTVSNPGSPVLRPGPWGTIYPVQDLRSMEGRFNEGLVVANIEVLEEPNHPGGLAYYAEKFHLGVAGTAGRGSLWLQVTGPTSSAQFVQATTGEMRPVTGFIRIVETLHAAPGAVRWRWREADESAWVWCGGCCDWW